VCQFNVHIHGHKLSVVQVPLVSYVNEVACCCRTDQVCTVLLNGNFTGR